MRNIPWSDRIHRLTWSGLDVRVPPICGGCQRRVPELRQPCGERCGIPIRRGDTSDRGRSNPPADRMMRLWAVFDSWVQDALPALKDRRKMGPGKADAAQMAERVRSRGWGPDGLSPDALWKARETRSQGRDNVDGADPADGRAVKDESVVLMNEVATVGSAILACTPAF